MTKEIGFVNGELRVIDEAQQTGFYAETTHVNAGPRITLYHNDTGAIDEVCGDILFKGKDDGSAVRTYARIKGFVHDNTAPGIGQIKIQTLTGSDGLVDTHVFGDNGGVELISNIDNSSGPSLLFYHETDTAANTDTVGTITFDGSNDAAEHNVEYLKLEVYSDDVTDASEDMAFGLSGMTGGASQDILYYKEGGLYAETGSFAIGNISNAPTELNYYEFERDATQNDLKIASYRSDFSSERVIIGGYGCDAASDDFMSAYVSGNYMYSELMWYNAYNADGSALVASDGRHGLAQVVVPAVDGSDKKGGLQTTQKAFNLQEDLALGGFVNVAEIDTANYEFRFGFYDGADVNTWGNNQHVIITVVDDTGTDYWTIEYDDQGGTSGEDHSANVLATPGKHFFYIVNDANGTRAFVDGTQIHTGAGKGTSVTTNMYAIVQAESINPGGVNPTTFNVDKMFFTQDPDNTYWA